MRKSDSLDFHEVSVWGLEAALNAAFEAGQALEQERVAENSVPRQEKNISFRDSKNTLREKLDQNLLAHFDALKQQEQISIGDLYQLQALCETNFYMVVEHEYTPADVEALLQFKDPLAAAMAAKDENTRDYTFPVADILKEMEAYERFPLAEKPEKAGPKRSASVRARLQDAMKELKEKPAPEAKSRDDGAR